jgi:hypothetical protein
LNASLHDRLKLASCSDAVVAFVKELGLPISKSVLDGYLAQPSVDLNDDNLDSIQPHMTRPLTQPLTESSCYM